MTVKRNRIVDVYIGERRIIKSQYNKYTACKHICKFQELTFGVALSFLRKLEKTIRSYIV